MVQAPLFVKVPLRMTLPLLTQAMPCCPHVSLAGVQAQCVQYAQETHQKAAVHVQSHSIALHCHIDM